MITDRTNFSIDTFRDARIIDGEFKSKGIDRRRHLVQVMPLARISGHVMEFGVYQGKTMQHISQYFHDQTCWGFDSFVGLPEPWHIREGPQAKTHPSGKFDMRQETQQPQFSHNVTLVPGWFDQSLPEWLSQHAGAVRFLHIDCDLYSSTKTVLSLLDQRIRPGTVIVFDEMYSWDNPDEYNLWHQGEYRAVTEWLEEYGRSFKTLFRTRHQQCSIQVIT